MWAPSQQQGSQGRARGRVRHTEFVIPAPQSDVPQSTAQLHGPACAARRPTPPSAPGTRARVSTRPEM